LATLYHALFARQVRICIKLCRFTGLWWLGLEMGAGRCYRIAS